MDPVIKSGDLVKAPPPDTTFSRWKKRHFKLRKSSMEYYVDGSGLEIKGIISMSDVTKLEADVKHSRSNVFALHTMDRTYYFDAPTALAREEWIEAITRCLESFRPEDFQTGNYMNKANVARFMEAKTDDTPPGMDDNENENEDDALSPLPGPRIDSIDGVPDGEGGDNDEDMRPEFQARAIHPYNAANPRQLSLTEGDVFEVLDSAAPWWIAVNNKGEEGLVPSNFLDRLAVPLEK